MKICKFIPAVIALLVLIGAPMSKMAPCNAQEEAGLVCYCCLDAGKKCAMLSCAGCPSQTGPDVSRMGPEIVIRIPNFSFILQPVFYDIQSFPKPQPVYLEVPLQPPLIS